nr:hypothetical protein [uncultured Holophaga sp.]
MKTLITSLLLGSGLLAAGLGGSHPPSGRITPQQDPGPEVIRQAFGRQGIRLSLREAARIQPDVLQAIRDARAHGLGNSKVDFAAVQIGHDLGLDTGPGSAAVRHICAALGELQRLPLAPPQDWDAYYRETLDLWNRPAFLGLMARHQFHPVKISWEDIGRSANSCWGDRISDVGIWVREVEDDPDSARLALSIRRDGNFRDKVLVVPAERIKVHSRQGGRTVEKTLPQRLAELGLASPVRDQNVIVSNQFAIVPVPGRGMEGTWKPGVPPRAAFTFSIFPYGSTNYVITDVIEGSAEAVVGPGGHQLLYADLKGRKAPFTASRAEERLDLLRMERDLKAKGMDVDVQRYYLIQVPLRRDAGAQASHMGAPPMDRGHAGGMVATPCPAPSMALEKAPKMAESCERSRGLDRVAIGHGEAEGDYFGGSGFRGARADEPIRVTVVYFVTPRGPVTEADMQTFTRAFGEWDSKAIWGGSFVVK